MDEHQPVDLGTIPHHDSGYFPGMSNRDAGAVLIAAGICIALIAAGVWYLFHSVP